MLLVVRAVDAVTLGFGFGMTLGFGITFRLGFGLATILPRAAVFEGRVLVIILAIGYPVEISSFAKTPSFF